MKTLKQILELYKPKSQDEDKFVKKHIVVKHKDRNGNGDDVFQATNIKAVGREKERHGYEPGEDEKVYEEYEDDFEDKELNEMGGDQHYGDVDPNYFKKGNKATPITPKKMQDDAAAILAKSFKPKKKLGEEAEALEEKYYNTPGHLKKQLEDKYGPAHTTMVHADENSGTIEHITRYLNDDGEDSYRIIRHNLDGSGPIKNRTIGKRIRNVGGKRSLKKEEYEALDESYDEMKSHYDKWANAHTGDGGTPDVKAAAKHKQNIILKYGPVTFQHFQRALRANMNQKYDNEETHLDNAFQNAESVREEVERLDEVGDTQRGQELLKRVAARSAERLAASKEKINVIRNKQDAIDAEHGSKAAKNMPQMKNLENQANDEIKNVDRHYKTHHDAKALMDPRKRSQMGMKKIGEEYIEEKLKVSDGIGAWISDFVHSDNPKFEGFSKRKRMKMAQAAFYSAQKGD